MDFLIFGIIIFIALFIITYRAKKGENVYIYVKNQLGQVYEKIAPYSYKTIKEKVKEMNAEYTTKDYLLQVVIFGGVAGGIAYLYFYSIIWSIVYALVAISFIPYLAQMRYKRIYSEFIFEQIQTYATNTIMEYQTTKSFVKALEGIVESGVLEEPVLGDVKKMLTMAYENGQIDDSLHYMSTKYNYHIVKNLHQLFLQVTKEGAHDISGSLDNMSLDIDTLVEGVYIDRMERQQFHKQFISYGLMLFLLVAVIQLLLGTDSYLKMIELWYIQLVLHAILLFNSYFLLNGEKYYNENVGAE
ncbi:MAG: hypothetical protein IJO32_07490 [Bacilli bacterium]|nr:hypothetical protein [Bacilli bacterium]